MDFLFKLIIGLALMAGGVKLFLSWKREQGLPKLILAIALFFIGLGVLVTIFIKWIMVAVFILVVVAIIAGFIAQKKKIPKAS